MSSFANGMQSNDAVPVKREAGTNLGLLAQNVASMKGDGASSSSVKNAVFTEVTSDESDYEDERFLQVRAVEKEMARVEQKIDELSLEETRELEAAKAQIVLSRSMFDTLMRK